MGHIEKEGTVCDLKPESTLERIFKYKASWIQHVNTMQRNRIPKL
jgi:hypothetical protein